jgi:dimethylaniline monooxygenase (N-oxide forming)
MGYQLVSSKQLTTFSDFKHHSNVDLLSTKQYVEYLHDYCTHLNLWPCIRLNTRVLSVTRGAGGGHILSYQANDSQTRYEWKCDAVAVFSGLHVAPNVPDIRGIQSAPQILRSSELKSRNQFGVDKAVMVVGSGETGSDIAYLAVTSTTKQVLLCHNGGVHFAPKVGFTLRLTLLSSVA